MALTVPELTAARDALLRARADGVRRYRDQNGEEVEYRSDSEMARALAALDSEIARAASARPTTLRFITTKGL
ncbi:hypothetical protein OG2516_17448 [Oceanicola granulosus HTCC2516]|uniref:Uncharacterized protein n=1 Tax=Oceanicola granulosus (strain ATCC BAA-861 / DSM 15982 / KCTC 12143 / HTCC2516) TaxID=314256 RepID=Q2CB94_OCEGH|nr:hypothetical protein [Oceanicola granulosus]EAR49945.1 hypothetical protein OG2516_17448 [Oceanicola granulosus HTCC2516]